MGKFAIAHKEIHFDVFLYNATSQFDILINLRYPRIVKVWNGGR
ncbi:MAG: hypothetical protein ABSA46_05445 [Thermodesulfovibrionales bacterium]|jgi:hypothetical protein